MHVLNKSLTKSSLNPHFGSSVFSWTLLSFLETFINFSVQIWPHSLRTNPFSTASIKPAFQGTPGKERFTLPCRVTCEGKKGIAIILSVFHRDTLRQELMGSFSALLVVPLPTQVTSGRCYGTTVLRLHAKGPSFSSAWDEAETEKAALSALKKIRPPPSKF